jgi:hypothetical protein
MLPVRVRKFLMPKACKAKEARDAKERGACAANELEAAEECSADEEEPVAEEDIGEDEERCVCSLHTHNPPLISLVTQGQMFY